MKSSLLLPTGKILFALSGWLLLAPGAFAAPAEAEPRVAVRWDKVLRECKTVVSIQDCPEPPLFRGKPTHDPIYKALRELKADYARFGLWYPYPRLAVAELEPPRQDRTFWDFRLLDDVVADFMEAAEGRPVVFDLGPTPQWMWKTPRPVPYPSNPEEITWDYNQGTELRDPTLKEIADYYRRMAEWYIKGGFTDERGQWHESGHHYRFAYWEVLNEVDTEHNLSPEQYTRIYDAIVKALRKVDPAMKYCGLALANPAAHPDYFEYFLNPKNHQPGIPRDMISYHFYSGAEPDAGPEVQQFTIFQEADRFLVTVRFIEAIRERLSPKTKTYINELGSFLPGFKDPQLKPIPDSYWNLSGAMWAYAYLGLARMGIDMVAGAELIDYPGQFACTTLLDWDSGKPNARYWVLKLLRENCLPGDKLVETQNPCPYVSAQAFVGRDATRKLLLINRRDRAFDIVIPGGTGARIEVVDQTTGFNPPGVSQLQGEQLSLKGLAVAIITLKQ